MAQYTITDPTPSKPKYTITDPTPPAPPSAPGIGQRIHDAIFVGKPDASSGDEISIASNAMGEIPSEIGKEFMSSARSLGHHLVPRNVQDFSADPTLAAGLDVAGMLASPVTGALNAVVGIPIEKTTGIRREIPGGIASMFIPGGEAANVSKVAKVADKSPAAIKYVSELMKKAGKTPADLTTDPAFAMGKPVTGAESIGRVGINQLASLARRAGKTPDAAESMLRQRLETTPDRVQADFAHASGADPAAVQGNFDTLTANLRKKASPLYEKAYSGAAPTASPELKELLKRPSMKKALGKARELAAEEGRNPDEVAKVTKYDRVYMGMDHEGQPQYGLLPIDLEITNPTMQTWDYIKRGLGQVINGEHRDLTGKLKTDESTRATIGTLDTLRDRLFTMNPSYREAVAAGGEPLQLEEAYREAPKMMNSSVPESVFAKRIAKFTPAQMEAFKGGWVNNVYEQVRAGKLKLKDMRSENFRTKAATLLGPDKANQFIARVEQEQRLTANANRMMPGKQSITGELLEAGRETDDLMRDIHAAGITTVHRGPVKGALDFVIDRSYRMLDRALTPGNEALRDEIGRLLQMPPDELQKALATPAGKTSVAQKLAKAVVASSRKARPVVRLGGVQDITNQISNPY